MPGRTGPELVEEFVPLLGHGSVRFISGYTRGAMLTKVSLPAGSDFLIKPFADDDVLQRLGTLLAAPARTRR